MGNKLRWIYANSAHGVETLEIEAPDDLLPPPELQFYRVLYGPVTFYFVPMSSIGTEGEG